MSLQELPAAVREGDDMVAAVQRKPLDESLTFEVPEVTVTHVEAVSSVAQISFRDDTEGTHNGQRSGVAAVQRVITTAVPYQLAFKAARQLQTLSEHVARVVVPPIAVTLDVPLPVALGAWIVKPARVVDVEVVAGAWVGVVTGIEVQVPSPTASAV